MAKSSSSLVGQVHGSKGFLAGKLSFKGQKALRVRTAIEQVGYQALGQALADFARTGVVNPQTGFVRQGEPYKNNPMAEIAIGSRDENPFRIGRVKARHLSGTMNSHPMREVMAALTEVIGGADLKIEPTVVTIDPLTAARSEAEDARILGDMPRLIAAMKRLFELTHDAA